MRPSLILKALTLIMQTVEVGKSRFIYRKLWRSSARVFVLYDSFIIAALSLYLFNDNNGWIRLDANDSVYRPELRYAAGLILSKPTL